MILANSPVTAHLFDQRPFYLKRDDLLHPDFSGNKARKLMSLLSLPKENYHSLISYGSTQSNAMYSLAALAKIKGWQFDYYVQHIPSWLKANPIGNYRAALELGMSIHSMQELNSDFHPNDYIQLVRGIDEKSLFVSEGGRASIAEAGVSELAKEIIDWHSLHNIKNCVVALPSGTGTTAVYLQKHLIDHGIEVLTCPCVGGENYLKVQFAMLEKNRHPTILTANKKHHFGKLYQEDFALWQALLAQTGVEFDLLYDPYMWQCLIPWLKAYPHKTLLYIHQGGLKGNESMLARYQRPNHKSTSNQ